MCIWFGLLGVVLFWMGCVCVNWCGIACWFAGDFGIYGCFVGLFWCLRLCLGLVFGCMVSGFGCVVGLLA